MLTLENREKLAQAIYNSPYSIKELAKAAGLSTATVYKLSNRNPSVGYRTTTLDQVLPVIGLTCLFKKSRTYN